MHQSNAAFRSGRNPGKKLRGEYSREMNTLHTFYRTRASVSIAPERFRYLTSFSNWFYALPCSAYFRRIPKWNILAQSIKKFLGDMRVILAIFVFVIIAPVVRAEISLQEAGIRIGENQPWNEYKAWVCQGDITDSRGVLKLDSRDIGCNDSIEKTKLGIHESVNRQGTFEHFNLVGLTTPAKNDGETQTGWFRQLSPRQFTPSNKKLSKQHKKWLVPHRGCFYPS